MDDRFRANPNKYITGKLMRNAYSGVIYVKSGFTDFFYWRPILSLVVVECLQQHNSETIGIQWCVVACLQTLDGDSGLLQLGTKYEQLPNNVYIRPLLFYM